MAITVTCQCQHSWDAGDDLAGTTVPCPKCAHHVLIPSPGDQPTELFRLSDTASDPDKTKLDDPGDTVTDRPALPTDGSSAPTEESAIAADTIPLADEAPAEQSSAPCPHCNAAMAPNAVICLECGYNLRTRETIHTETKVEAPQQSYLAATLEDLWLFFRQFVDENRYAVSFVLGCVVIGVVVSVWVSRTSAELTRQQQALMREGKGLDNAFSKIQDKSYEGLLRMQREDPEIAGPKAMEQYLDARTLLRDGKRAEARQKLEHVIVTWPTQTAADKAKELLKQIDQEMEAQRNALAEQSEAKAQEMVDKAHALAKEGKVAEARKLLKAVLNVLGETRAAETARKTLKSLDDDDTDAAEQSQSSADPN